MLDDYKIEGEVTRIELEIEIETAEQLAKMSAHTKLSKSEIVNTALKRFIVTHKDFMPERQPG